MTMTSKYKKCISSCCYTFFTMTEDPSGTIRQSKPLFPQNNSKMGSYKGSHTMSTSGFHTCASAYTCAHMHARTHIHTKEIHIALRKSCFLPPQMILGSEALCSRIISEFLRTCQTRIGWLSRAFSRLSPDVTALRAHADLKKNDNGFWSSIKKT